MKKMLLEMVSELREENKKLKLEVENLTGEVKDKSETMIFWFGRFQDLERKYNELNKKDNE